MSHYVGGAYTFGYEEATDRTGGGTVSDKRARKGMSKRQVDMWTERTSGGKERSTTLTEYGKAPNSRGQGKTNRAREFTLNTEAEKEADGVSKL